MACLDNMLQCSGQAYVFFFLIMTILTDYVKTNTNDIQISKQKSILISVHVQVSACVCVCEGYFQWLHFLFIPSLLTLRDVLPLSQVKVLLAARNRWHTWQERRAIKTSISTCVLIQYRDVKSCLCVCVCVLA